MYKPFGSLVKEVVRRVTGVSPANDLLMEKLSNIQKILLFTANFSIAEILTSSSTRENHRDRLVSEGSCVVIAASKCGMNIVCPRVGSTTYDC